MKVILFSIVAVVGLLLIAVICGCFMPTQWQAVATKHIDASPAAVHAFLDDTHTWSEWTPWDKAKDPSVTYATSGSPHGVGAVFTWNGEKVGQGTLTLTKSDPSVGVAYDLVLRGADRPSHGEVLLEGDGTGTKVTWKDGGDLGTNPIARLFRGVVERVLAVEFEAGLSKLKALVEAKKS